MSTLTFTSGSHQPVVGTSRNRERTGKRTVSRLSSIARRIEGVRHFDCDLYQVCATCREPQLFAEVKTHSVSDAEWYQVRQQARAWNCIGLLCVEPDIGSAGIRIYYPEADLITPLSWCGEEGVEAVLRMARDRHRCRKAG